MYYESCALTIPAMFSCFASFIVSRDRTALGYTRGTHEASGVVLIYVPAASIALYI